jgi:signal transduction histidine kinase
LASKCFSERATSRQGRRHSRGVEIFTEGEGAAFDCALAVTSRAHSQGLFNCVGDFDVNHSNQVNDELKAVAEHMRQRRDAILSAWRQAVDIDPELTTASLITRTQFIDHIPAVLDAFERRLSAEDSTDRAQAREDERVSAAEHGLHRWQQGYNQPETMREWGHLHLCLLQELEQYETVHPGLERNTMRIAHRELVRLCSDGVCFSAARYAQLQQNEAASRVSELESALAQLRTLEIQRAESWRQAAHDLRGSAHVIVNASTELSRGDDPDPKRLQFSEILRRGVESLNNLLTDLMDHARLEAGHEQRNLVHFDVAVLLTEFCNTTRPLATERHLSLAAEGPDSLMIDGDPAKTLRIVQNLVLNALHVTLYGGVRVTWQVGGSDIRPQWVLCVQDTGPGFRNESATPLEHNLKHATAEAHEVEAENHRPDPAPQSSSTPIVASQASPRANVLPHGEGIGLSIVKRLCELLDASLELQSAEGEGTTFRVIFPRHYADSADAIQ